MRKSALLSAVLSLGLVGTLLVGCQSYEYQTVENDPLNAKIYTLPNGLKVYMTVNKEQPRIQTYIAVRTGGKNDPAETTGLAHYLEHLMFKGTSHFGTQNFEAEKPLLDSITDLFELYRSKTDPEERKAIYHRIDSISGVAAKYAIPNEYDKMMAMIGASGTNAYTSEDVTCYTEDIPSNQIENWAKIQGERFKDPVFRLFHTELEAVYEEKNIALTRDIRKEFEVINEVLAPNHPYGKQTVIGTQEHLKNPSLINIRNYFNTWYVPNNVAICLSGDFEPDQMVRVITKYFGDWQPRELPSTDYPAIEPLQAPVTREVWGQEAENVILAWTFPGAADPMSDQVDFLSSVLYNGKAGLFDLDLNQGMKVLTAQAFVDRKTDATTLMLYGRPLPGQSLEEVRQLLLEEVQKIITAKFDGDLVSSVLTDYKLSLQKQLENNSDRASMFVESFVNGQPWEEAVRVIDRYAHNTKMSLAYFAKKHLTEPLIPPRSVNKDIPESVSRIIIKMMAKNPSMRYQDASELIDDLRNARRGKLAGPSTDSEVLSGVSKTATRVARPAGGGTVLDGAVDRQNDRARNIYNLKNRQQDEARKTRTVILIACLVLLVSLVAAGVLFYFNNAKAREERARKSMNRRSRT